MKCVGFLVLPKGMKAETNWTKDNGKLNAADSVLTDFKVNAAKTLSPYASAILVDQQFCYRQVVEQNAIAKSCAMIVAADEFIPGNGAGIIPSKMWISVKRPLLSPSCCNGRPKWIVSQTT